MVVPATAMRSVKSLGSKMCAAIRATPLRIGNRPSLCSETWLNPRSPPWGCHEIEKARMWAGP